MKLAATVALTLVLLVSLAVAAWAAPQSGTALVPHFASELITQPVDVTDADLSAIAPSAVTRDQAIGLARREYDRKGSTFRVYRAISRQYVSSPDRDVWVIVFSGGTPFFGGPMENGGEPATVAMTGIIIDAETGEFLRGFME